MELCERVQEAAELSDSFRVEVWSRHDSLILAVGEDEV